MSLFKLFVRSLATRLTSEQPSAPGIQPGQPSLEEIVGDRIESLVAFLKSIQSN